MEKYPSEVFGHPTKGKSHRAHEDHRNYWCPFTDARCIKKSRMIDYPMGVCSVQYGVQPIAICPVRFMQDDVIFKNIADHYFGTRSDLLLFKEVGLPNVGNFDFVMVKHKAMSSEIEDFVIIEFQTGQTTSTGKLVEALEDSMKGIDVARKKYGFGMNMADIWKRTFTQILNKGIVVESWGNMIYWVVQEPVYQNFVDRYNLHNLKFDDTHSTVFMVYDLEQNEDTFQIVLSRTESSTIDNLFAAFRNNPNIPSKDHFVSRLGKKISENVQLRFSLE